MRQYKQDGIESGQVLPLTGLLLIPLLILAAFAIDIGSFYLRASELQTLSDLTALAGAEAKGNGATDAEVQKLIEDLLVANGMDPNLADVEFNGNNVSVLITDEEVRQYFSTLIVDRVDVARDATATTGDCFSCEQPIELANTNFQLPDQGSGDGYKVEVVPVGSDIRFYALNHHEESNDQGGTTNQLVCVLASTGQGCFSGGVRLNTATTYESTIVATPDTSQLWYNSIRPDSASNTTSWGLGCITLEGIPCGGVGNGGVVQLGTEDRIIRRDGINNRDIGTYASEPIAHDNRVFMIDYKLTVHCFDALAGAGCSGYPQTPGGFGAARSDNWIKDRGVEWSQAGNLIESMTVNGKLYAGFTNSNEDGTTIVCFDMANNVPCSSWSEWTLSGGGASSIFPDFTEAAGENGACVFLWGDPSLNCRGDNYAPLNRSGVADVISNLGDNFPNGVVSNPTRGGRFLFIANQDDDNNRNATYCVDTITISRCPVHQRLSADFLHPSHIPYTYTKLPNQDCFVSLGHDSTMDFFTSNLGTCNPNASTQTIEPCDCGDGAPRWGNLNFDAVFLDAFDELLVTVIAPDGSVIIDSSDAIASGGRIELPDEVEGLPFLTLELEATASASFNWANPVIGSVAVVERAVLID